MESCKRILTFKERGEMESAIKIELGCPAFLRKHSILLNI
jgi:hypothetical protein